jgi:hypothetical protein
MEYIPCSTAPALHWGLPTCHQDNTYWAKYQKADRASTLCTLLGTYCITCNVMCNPRSRGLLYTIISVWGIELLYLSSQALGSTWKYIRCKTVVRYSYAVVTYHMLMAESLQNHLFQFAADVFFLQHLCRYCSGHYSFAMQSTHCICSSAPKHNNCSGQRSWELPGFRNFRNQLREGVWSWGKTIQAKPDPRPRLTLEEAIVTMEEKCIKCSLLIHVMKFVTLQWAAWRLREACMTQPLSCAAL